MISHHPPSSPVISSKPPQRPCKPSKKRSFSSLHMDMLSLSQSSCPEQTRSEDHKLPGSHDRSTQSESTPGASRHVIDRWPRHRPLETVASKNGFSICPVQPGPQSPHPSPVISGVSHHLRSSPVISSHLPSSPATCRPRSWLPMMTYPHTLMSEYSYIFPPVLRVTHTFVLGVLGRNKNMTD